MPLLLTEADVKSVFTMPMALELVETSFERLAEGKATLQYRQRLPVPGKGVLNHMAAADLTTGYLGLKIYSIAHAEGARFLVTLFGAETGELRWPSWKPIIWGSCALWRGQRRGHEIHGPRGRPGRCQDCHRPAGPHPACSPRPGARAANDSRLRP